MKYNILYKVVQESGNMYWQCFSLKRGHTATEIWNSEKYMDFIPKRIESIPKILAEEVCFDLNFRKLYPEEFSMVGYVCVLIADGETIIVTNVSTDLSDDKLKLTYLHLPGTIQDFYDGFAIIKTESDYILHAIFPVYKKPEDKKYPNIVRIEQVLKQDISDCEIPIGGLAMLDESGKIVEVMFKFKDFKNKKEFDIPVDEISFRKIKTSNPEKFVLEMNYWNNNEKKSFYQYEGNTFEI